MTLDCDLLPWLSNMNRKWCDKAASLISRSKVVLFKKIIVQKHIPDRLLYLLITFGFHRNYMKRISAAVHLPNKSRHLAFRRDLNVNSISANTNHHYIISSQSSYSIQMKCQTLPLKIPPPADEFPLNVTFLILVTICISPNARRLCKYNPLLGDIYFLFLQCLQEKFCKWSKMYHT